jgi:sirohydrochlorin cobaltochelatase
MRDLTAILNDWLLAGAGTIGQVTIRPVALGWELRHVADAQRNDLTPYDIPEAARHLANVDEHGAFRPLKTAPNLIRGWRVVLPDAPLVRQALDYLYPAMTGVWLSHLQGTLQSVSLRATLGRQTGMYRITQKISDTDARTTIDRFCAGCLKQRLWEISGPNPTPPQFNPLGIPLLCHEACNLLVAEIRKVVKTQSQPAATAGEK